MPSFFLIAAFSKGFLVGLHAESSGIAKHAAKLLTATACVKVPKLTILLGGSYGAGSVGKKPTL